MWSSDTAAAGSSDNPWGHQEARAQPALGPPVMTLPTSGEPVQGPPNNDGVVSTPPTKAPPGLQQQAADSTPMSVSEALHFRPIHCPVPLRTGEIVAEHREADDGYTRQNPGTCEEVVASHLAHSAVLAPTFTAHRVNVAQQAPLEGDRQDLRRTASFS